MTTLPLDTPGQAGAAPARATLAACVLAVFAWVLLASGLNESQLHDSLEQFVWGQGFEWGYWKHPPVTTWLAWASFKLFGVHPFTTYALGALLFAGTLVVTTRIAQRLLPAQAAAWVPLLLTLHYGFTRRAQIYNHNTVVVFFVALAVLALLVALPSRRWRDWAWFGAAGALAVLSKYQAVLPLACALGVAAWLGQLSLRQAWRSLAVAALVGLAVLSPHLLWLVRHDFASIGYALHYVDGSDMAGNRLLRPGAFLVTQLRYYGPVLLLALVLGGCRLLRHEPLGRGLQVPLSRTQRAWLWGLAGVPLLLVMAAALGLGVRVQSHWGLQVTQFLVLALAPLMLRVFGRWDRRCWRAWVAVQVLTMGFMAGQGLGWIPYDARSAEVREVPASDIAREARLYWAARTHCPLRYLAGGHSPAAAMVAAYGNQPLRVLEDRDPAKSPWIDLVDMRSSGWLEVELQSEAPPEGWDTVKRLKLRPHEDGTPPTQRLLVMRAFLPEAPCGDPVVAHH